jgi:toxin FitB
MILVDTNILSELWRPLPNSFVVQWLEIQPREGVFVSAITLAELHFGIARLDNGRNKARMLEAITKLGQETFEGRVLGFDSRAAAHFGAIRASREKAGRPINFPDAAIASLTVTYGLTLATRNTKDFDGLNIPLVNPFEPQA